MKRVLLTGGATNEYIDEVMKITNMATGESSLVMAGLFSRISDIEVTLIGNRALRKHKLFLETGYHYIPIETTEDMDEALEEESRKEYDLVIHSSAVGDYKPVYSFRLEDIALEIFNKLKREDITTDKILDILLNPECKIRDDSKISSYEANLTVKLGLTKKLIGTLRHRFPLAKIIGFKLLDKVSKEYLIEVAKELSLKNAVDYIIANDLRDINRGYRRCYLVNKEGYAGKDFSSNEDIFNFALSLI